jgi:tRNA-dependent cyclodipeptide synthase
MKVIDTSPIGMQVLQKGKPLIIGVSLSNSYFTKENLQKILSWAGTISQEIYIMIPDKPAVFTMRARGKSEKDAISLARRETKKLMSVCNEVIHSSGLDDVTFVTWEHLETNSYYLESLSEIEHEYGSSPEFAEAIRAATLPVISLVRGRQRVPTEEELELGVQFLLKELAFISEASMILSQGKVAYVYHQTMHIFKEILEGEYSFRASTGVGYITVE